MSVQGLFMQRPYLSEEEKVSHGRSEWITSDRSRTTEQKPMSDEEGLRELNPFKSPK